jgi:hypothetical protein
MKKKLKGRASWEDVFWQKNLQAKKNKDSYG